MVSLTNKALAGNLVFINAPSYAASIWSIAKRIIDPNTANRISIIPGPATDYLLHVAGPSVLPIEFGGNNPYVLPHCLAKMDSKFEADFPLS